jgi:hypothetical protein
MIYSIINDGNVTDAVSNQGGNNTLITPERTKLYQHVDSIQPVGN